MGESRPLIVYFRPFLITILIIYIEKSIDGVLGIGTHGRMIVGADNTTELWRPPTLVKSLSVPDHINNFSAYMYLCYAIFKQSYWWKIIKSQSKNEQSVILHWKFIYRIGPWSIATTFISTLISLFVSNFSSFKQILIPLVRFLLGRVGNYFCDCQRSEW